MKRLTVVFFFLTAQLFSAAPDHVWSVWRADLAHAYYYYVGDSHRCVFAIIAERPAYAQYLAQFPNQFSFENSRTRFVSPALRERLVEEGKRVRNETFPSFATALRQTWGPKQDNRPSLGVVADIIRDEQDSPALSLINHGLHHLPSLPPTEEESFEAFRRLFYLIKFNRIPQFLLESGIFQFSANEEEVFGLYGMSTRVFPRDGEPSHHRDQRVFFDEGIFYGAELNTSDLAQTSFQVHLLNSPTFEYLELDIGYSEFGIFLESPALSSVRSLNLRIGPGLTDGPWRGDQSEPPNVSPRGTPLPNLRRLILTRRSGSENDSVIWALRRRALWPKRLPQLREIHLANLVRSSGQSLTSLPRKLRSALKRYEQSGVKITWSYADE